MLNLNRCLGIYNTSTLGGIGDPALVSGLGDASVTNCRGYSGGSAVNPVTVLRYRVGQRRQPTTPVSSGRRNLGAHNFLASEISAPATWEFGNIGHDVSNRKTRV